MSLATNVLWKDIKDWLDTTNLLNILNYKQFEAYWLVWLEYEGLTMWTNLEKTSADAEDFVDNYLPLTVLKKTVSDDGYKHLTVQGVLEKKYLRKYCCQGSTATPQADGENFSFYMLDSNGDITTVSNEVVKTCIRFAPNFSYSILGGELELIGYDLGYDGDIFVNVVGNPEIPENLGGSVRCIDNERYIKDSVKIESNWAMPLTYIQDQNTNIILIELMHPIGLVREYQVKINFYS